MKSISRIRINSKFPNKETKDVIAEVAKRQGVRPDLLELAIRSEFLFVEEEFKKRNKRNIFLSGFGRFLYMERYEYKVERQIASNKFLKELHEKKKTHIHDGLSVDGHQDSKGQGEDDSNKRGSPQENTN